MRDRDRELRIETLRRSLDAGDLEKVKRAAEALHEVGGDPVAFLKAAATDGTLDSKRIALGALESLDSSAFRLFTGSSEPEAMDKNLCEDAGFSSGNEGLFYLWIDQKMSKPHSMEDIRRLMLEGVVTEQSFSAGSDSEWRMLKDRREFNGIRREVVGKSRRSIPTTGKRGKEPPAVLSRLICLLGGHEYNEWRYRDDVSCEVVLFCGYCTSTRVGESWHLDGAIEYAGDNSCNIVRKCLRCGDVKKEGVGDHQWSEWAPRDPCTTIRSCNRCGKNDFKFSEHAFGALYKTEGCVVEQKCRLCGSTRSSREHAWGVWDYESPGKCDLVRFCRRCHEEEYGDRKHRWLERKDPDTRRNERVCIRCGTID